MGRNCPSSDTVKSLPAELIPQIYDELHRLAFRYLQGEGVDHSLQTTALVHEAYFRLNQKQVEWSNRNHCFRVAAPMMRRILVDHARQHDAFKGGVEDASRGLLWMRLRFCRAKSHAVDELLDRLAALDPEGSRVVELRFSADSL